jgi:P-type Cu+ transporter
MAFLRILGITLVIAALALSGCGKAEKESTPQTAGQPADKAVADYTPTQSDIGQEVVCSVCGMTIAVKGDTPAVMYDGKPYYFCDAGEKTKFAADPKKYLNKPAEGSGTE